MICCPGGFHDEGIRSKRLQTDDKSSYRVLGREVFGDSVRHETTPGQMARGTFNPLFPINLTLAMTRDNCGRLRRQSWLVTEKRRCLQLHLHVFAAYRNYVRRRHNTDEPDDTPAFGREAGESSSSRAAYDDVDDYHGWSGSPPVEKDDAAIANAAGFTRIVKPAFFYRSYRSPGRTRISDHDFPHAGHGFRRWTQYIWKFEISPATSSTDIPGRISIAITLPKPDKPAVFTSPTRP